MPARLLHATGLYADNWIEAEAELVFSVTSEAAYITLSFWFPEDTEPAVRHVTLKSNADSKALDVVAGAVSTTRLSLADAFNGTATISVRCFDQSAPIDADRRRLGIMFIEADLIEL